MLLSLGHVTVRSTDFDRTERFYCGLLGLRVGPRPAIPVPGLWLYLGDAAVLHVLPRVPPAAGEAGSDTDLGVARTIDHFAFDAKDRPAFEARLRAAGQPFKTLRLTDGGAWQIFLLDPDGARVELSFAEAAAP